MRRGLLPAVLIAIGLYTVIFGDFTGDHRVRAGGVVIVGAAILMAVAGSFLRRPDDAAQFELRDWASYVGTGVAHRAAGSRSVVRACSPGIRRGSRAL